MQLPPLHKQIKAKTPSAVSSCARNLFIFLKVNLMLKTNKDLAITNSQFLRTVFGSQPANFKCWTTSFKKYPAENMPHIWTGKLTTIEECPDYPESNAYFSVALFDQNKNPSGRTIAEFNLMTSVVLDDVESSSIEPSWKLETSKNNYQLGFLLKEPITDTKLAKRLLNEIQRKSLVNLNDHAGNNIVRYVRLPVGANTKNGGFFPHVLREWRPELRYTLEELIKGLGLDAQAVLQDRPIASKTTSFENFRSGVDVAEMTRQILNSEHYFDPCLKLTSHYIGLGMHPDDVLATVQGIMLSVEDKPNDWSKYYSLLPNMVSGAAQKFKLPTESLDLLDVFKPYEYDTTKLVASRFVIDGFLSAEIFTIAGESGVGKSSILVPLAAIAAHICRPEEPLKPKLRRKVVYLTEDPEQVERILFAIKKHWEITISNDEMRDWFTVIPVHRSKKEVLGDLIRKYSSLKSVQQLGKKGLVNVPALFVFDTAAATFSLDSENDNAEVSAAISICKKACLENRSPLWIVSHIPKAVTGDQMKNLSARGAGAWTGDVNGTAFIGKNDDGTNIRYMWLGKRRYVAEYDTLAFEASFASELVEDELGDVVEIPYMFGTARKSSLTERIDKAQTARDETLRKRIFYTVQEANQKGVPINRTAVRDIIKGSSSIATQTIATMISEGILEEYERTDKGNNNQKMALRIAQFKETQIA